MHQHLGHANAIRTAIRRSRRLRLRRRRLDNRDRLHGRRGGRTAATRTTASAAAAAVPTLAAGAAERLLAAERLRFGAIVALMVVPVKRIQTKNNADIVFRRWKFCVGIRVVNGGGGAGEVVSAYSGAEAYTDLEWRRRIALICLRVSPCVGVPSAAAAAARL